MRIGDALRAALFLYNGREGVCGWVRVLGRGGMFLQNKARFPKDTEIFVETTVWENDTRHHLKVRGWVAYENRHGMGIQFDRTDSATHTVIDHLMHRYAARTA